ncbi:MAG: single-stranded DNA-binding protein, partial [Bryobacteraceae bacterium]
KKHVPKFGSNQPRVFVPKHSRAERRKKLTNLNQLSIIGFIGKNAETKYLPNGTPVTKFSVATKKSWKDENGEWKEKTQWHNVAAFGKGFAQLADRFVKGPHVFAQGELTIREYDRTIKVPIGKGKSIEHAIQQLVVELKADTSGHSIVPPPMASKAIPPNRRPRVTNKGLRPFFDKVSLRLTLISARSPAAARSEELFF